MKICIYVCILYERVLVIQFGTNTSGTPTALANNDILFASEVIFCVTERGSGEVVWTYTSDSNDQIQENLIATSWNAATGVSTLNVSTGKQGFYQCSVTQNNGVDAFFKVGVFNRRDTTGNFHIMLQLYIINVVFCILIAYFF